MRPKTGPRDAFREWLRDVLPEESRLECRESEPLGPAAATMWLGLEIGGRKRVACVCGIQV